MARIAGGDLAKQMRGNTLKIDLAAIAGTGFSKHQGYRRLSLDGIQPHYSITATITFSRRT